MGASNEGRRGHDGGGGLDEEPIAKRLRLFMQGLMEVYVALGANRLIGAYLFCPVPLWPQIFGRVLISQCTLCPSSEHILMFVKQVNDGS